MHLMEEAAPPVAVHCCLPASASVQTPSQHEGCKAGDTKHVVLVLCRYVGMAFRSWRAYAERRQQLQGSLAAAVGGLRNRHLAAAFHTWQEHVQGKRGAEAKLQRAVGVLRNKALAGAWQGWRLQVAVAAEHRHKVRSIHWAEDSLWHADRHRPACTRCAACSSKGIACRKLLAEA